MLYYAEIIGGIVIAYLLSMVLGYFLGTLGSLSGFVIATIIVGYHIHEDIIYGAIYGCIVGVSTGILAFISMIFMSVFFKIGPGFSMMEFGIFGMIIGLVVDGILGTTGGIIGSRINYNRNNW